MIFSAPNRIPTFLLRDCDVVFAKLLAYLLNVSLNTDNFQIISKNYRYTMQLWYKLFKVAIAQILSY